MSVDSEPHQQNAVGHARTLSSAATHSAKAQPTEAGEASLCLRKIRNGSKIG